MHPVPFQSRCIKNSRNYPSQFFPFQPKRNVITGDNESGKSSMLLVLGLVLSDSRPRIESPGIKVLLSQQAYPGQASAISYYM